VGLIEQHDAPGLQYEWVVRARLDSFWSRPAPLRNLNASAYTIPFGSGERGPQ